jgi:8-oxo-dGTP diphosphatase
MILARPRRAFPLNYVVVHVVNPTNRVLLIEKDRPEWMKGRLNLAGGKVEPGEKPAMAAIRELKEETGLVAGAVATSGKVILSSDSVIHCFRAFVDDISNDSPREGETEKPRWFSWGDCKDDPRLMPNLRIISQ